MLYFIILPTHSIINRRFRKFLFQELLAATWDKRQFTMFKDILLITDQWENLVCLFPTDSALQKIY